VSGAEHLRAMARLVVRGLRDPAPAGRQADAPRRRLSVEKTVVAEPAGVRRYLRATAGEAISAFRSPDAAVVPPLYGATWSATAALELLGQIDPPLPLGGFVHLEEEVLPIRPIRPGERVRFRVELDRVERSARGARLTLVARTWNAAGVLCGQSTSLILARTRDPRPVLPAGPPRPSAESEEWDEVEAWDLPSGAGRRYALASGDFNPIHLWGVTARPFGFRRPILHGFCTAAHVAHALIRRRLDGQPGALRRMQVAFRAPLLLPAHVRLLTAADAPHRFRMTDAAGAVVYAEGSCSAPDAPAV
jgi:acyl dehydratase